MSEDLDALLARLAREEQDDADRATGQDVVDALAAAEDAWLQLEERAP